MSTLLAYVFLGIYAVLALALLMYGVNCLVMVYLFRKRYAEKTQWQREFLSKEQVEIWPAVTTQIPVYNEANVVSRVIQSVVAMEYDGHHQIQVLDDSDDVTSSLVDREVENWKSKGVDIAVVRRQGREGFKAGALAYAHRFIKGDYVALFDADFVPGKDFLKKTIPYFLKFEKVGLIQTRWGHLNEEKSILTRIQALGIDGHFMVEQSGRCWNNLYMNFNGTAGIWRKQAIEDAGGWSADTLTEDMDLSYRVQLKGWKAEYLPELVVPAELPEDLRALKSQQFRWAKGSTQTAMKILPKVWKKDGLGFKWIQSFLHMTHYMVHPLMVLIAIFFLPVIHFSQQVELGMFWHGFILTVLVFSLISSNTLYAVSQKAITPNWWRKLIFLPVLMVVGVGLAVNNTKAVLEALFGRPSDFIRTPKKGDQANVIYKVKFPWMVILELALGIYCAGTLLSYLGLSKILLGPFIAIYALGFLSVGTCTLLQRKDLRVILGDKS